MICWVFAGASFWTAAGILGILAVAHLVEVVHRGRGRSGLGRKGIGQPVG